jgi:hypothetical protein
MPVLLDDDLLFAGCLGAAHGGGESVVARAADQRLSGTVPAASVEADR